MCLWLVGPFVEVIYMYSFGCETEIYLRSLSYIVCAGTGEVYILAFLLNQFLVEHFDQDPSDRFYAIILLFNVSMM